MDQNGFETHDEEIEWRMSIYRDLVRNDALQETAWIMAEELRSPHDPEVAQADVETARRYLQKIVLTADIIELSEMQNGAFAALWAKGALGAARYRTNNAGGWRRRRNA